MSDDNDPRLILGMDGGGTATTTWIADQTGAILGRGRAGPSNVKAVGVDAARTALDLSVCAAFHDAGREVGPVAVSCLGLAGFDRPEDKVWLEHWAADSGWAGRLVLVNDGDLVVAAGTPEGWGVGLIAGTGSIAVGRAPDGRSARAGGWGFVFGDEGSAFAIAVAALRRVARLADGRAPRAAGAGEDPLTLHICRALGIEGPSGLVAAIYGPAFNRAKVAGLAPAVVAAAEDDPSIGREVFEPAGAELAELVDAAARGIGRAGGPLPLALAGSFLLGCGAIRRVLLARLETLGYEVDAREVPDPVTGALVLARKESGR